MHEPALLVAQRRVKPGREKDYEQWLRGLVDLAQSRGCAQSVEVLRPGVLGGEYTVLYQFADHEDLRRWIDLPERTHWINQIDPDVVEGEASVRPLDGMAVWLAPKSRSQTPRYKLVIAGFLGAYPVVNTLTIVLSPHTTELPWPIRTMLFGLCMSFLMTYVTMPIITKVFGRWLYRA